jgi:hypothetical protein
MHIADAILHANSAGVVLFLLTSYIDAVRHDDLSKVLPQTCVDQGYRHSDDIARCLDAVLKRHPDAEASDANSIVAEVTRVFRAARNRLWQLEREAR